MPSESNSERKAEQSKIYQIRLRGHLDRKWLAWFDGLTLTLEEDGNTRLTGPIIDQAALHGVLKKVRDLGLPLLSVNAIEPDSPDPSGINT
jgi:hypothetical protein